MKPMRAILAKSLSLAAFLTAVSPVLAQESAGVDSWPAAPFWLPPRGALAPADARDRATPSPLALPSGPLPFVAITPCRLADTRPSGGFGGAFGPPILAANATRDFPITGQCGIPPSAQAVSANFTVTNAQGPGDLRIFPQGSAAPLVSTLNYVAGQTIPNAAVVPLGATGALTVQPDVSGTDLVIDVNGYYAPQAVVSSLNALSGAVSLAAGTNVTITPSAGTLTIAASGGGGGTITGVTAGTGLSGGGTSGSVSLDVLYGGNGAAATAARSDHDHDARYQATLVRTVVVSPVGTATQNGTALLNALAGITTASAASPWLLKIEPGVYDVGASGLLVMKPHVDIEGSGEKVTKIRAAGAPVSASGTITAADAAELRFLTVENTGGDAYAKSIYVNGVSPRITHVTALAHDATTAASEGIFVTGAGAVPVVTDFTCTSDAPATAASWCFINAAGAASKMRRVVSTATGGAEAASFLCSGASPEMSDLVAYANGADDVYGLKLLAASSPFVTRFTAFVGPASSSMLMHGTFGVYSEQSSPIFRQVEIDIGPGAFNTGFECDGGSLDVTGAKIYVSATSFAAGVKLGSHGLGQGCTLRLVGSRVEAYGPPNGWAVEAGWSDASIFSSTLLGSTWGLYGNASGGTGTYTLRADQSTISNAAALDNVTVSIAASSLFGAVFTSGTGAKNCVGVVDRNAGTFLASTCP